MAWRRTFLVTILGSMLAACSAASQPSPPLVSPRTDAPDLASTAVAASPTATVSPATQSAPATPEPTPMPTPVPVPPKPTGVKFAEQAREIEDGAYAEVTQTVTWQAPRTEGVEIRVYGVTECIAEPPDPPPGSGGPCLVVHTPLPASVRTLLATAPASGGSVSWNWTEDTGCRIGLLAFDPDGPAYHAVVLAAYDASGHSIFAIAEPGGWWTPDVGDIVC